MFKYYEGIRVKVVRSFFLDNNHYSVIRVNGEDVSVITKTLTDEKPEVIENTYTPEPKVTYTTINTEDILAKINTGTDIIINKEFVDIVGEIATPDEEVATETTEIFAKNKNGKEFNLGTVEELESSAQVIKLKFDVDAINRCLEGKQKQHKGYTFEARVN